MSVVAVEEVEKLAFELTEKERAKLAGKLLDSLPSPFDDDDDDGVAESLRRSREMDENPEMSLTEEEFFASFEKYRTK
ncbi:MAG TPA: addiction module protein [Pyrinomonadaceae bacterium]|nr:addiction module protein [Pyrinomonadaceae bacterium]